MADDGLRERVADVIFDDDGCPYPDNGRCSLGDECYCRRYALEKAVRAIGAVDAHRDEQRLQAHEMTFDPRHAVAVLGGRRVKPGGIWRDGKIIEFVDYTDDVDEAQR